MSLSCTNWNPFTSSSNPTNVPVIQNQSSLFSSKLLELSVKSADSNRYTYSTRPKLPNYVVLTNFCNGLTTTGLKPRKKLTYILDKWIVCLIREIQASCALTGLAKTWIDTIQCLYDSCSANSVNVIRLVWVF